MQSSILDKTHVIITFSKINYFITRPQFSAVSKMGNGESLTIEGNIVKTSNIADILTLEKFYETYPDKKAASYKSIPAEERVVFSKKQLIRALEAMIGGFKKHFGDRKLPERSQNILSHMENNLEQAKKASDKKTFRNPIWDYSHNY